MSGRATLVALTVVSVLASCLIAFRIYQDNDSDITSFVAFGEDDPVSADYGRERLGEVFLRSELGHDGKFFFIQANDPFLLDPEANASYLDDPVYRAQRMLYPVLAGAGGAASPEVIVWLMLLINLVGLGLGPQILPLVTDYVFRDGMQIHLSLLTVTVTAEVGAFAFLFLALPRFRRAIAYRDRWMSERAL